MAGTAKGKGKARAAGGKRVAVVQRAKKRPLELKDRKLMVPHALARKAGKECAMDHAFSEPDKSARSWSSTKGKALLEQEGDGGWIPGPAPRDEVDIFRGDECGVVVNCSHPHHLCVLIS